MRPLEYFFISKLNDICNIIISFNQCVSWALFFMVVFFAVKRSNSLGSFKWYLLNHAIWCILFETGMTLFRPVIFPQAFGGYCGGIFRHQGPRATLVQAGFCIMCGHNALVGVTISLVHRYFVSSSALKINSTLVFRFTQTNGKVFSTRNGFLLFTFWSILLWDL